MHRARYRGFSSSYFGEQYRFGLGGAQYLVARKQDGVGYGETLAGLGDRDGGLFESSSCAFEPVARGMLAYSVARIWLGDPGQCPFECGGEAGDITARKDFADALNEVRRRTYPVRYYGQRASSHCLVDYEAPSLGFTRQDKDVCRMIIRWEFRLVDKAGHDTCARLQ